MSKRRVFGGRKNRRFNRIETPNENFYFQRRGIYPLGSREMDGLLKCRLVHGPGYSLILPELLFLGDDASQWIQPIGFLPNTIAFYQDNSVCELLIDVSCGHVLNITFSSSDHLMRLEDRSELYRCTIQGPDLIRELATGRSRWNGVSAPEIELFHHTTEARKSAILNSQEFHLSKWNIQGTAKRATNVGFVYFTALDRIRCNSDLTQIGMSHDGTITLLTDDAEQRGFADSFVHLEVYAAKVADRSATLRFWISSDWLAPQHIWKHVPPGRFAYYEVCNPFTHRVALAPETRLKLRDEHHLQPGLEHKRFEYAVVGFCDSAEGLRAPFDEEDISHALKFEEPQLGEELLAAWKRHANQDRFSVLVPEPATFKRG